MPEYMRLSGAALVVLLTGCAVGTPYQQPITALPEQWPLSDMHADAAQQDWQHWWQQYQDPHLDHLVSLAMQDNLDLRLQLSRIREAHARLGLSQADKRPSISAQADAARERSAADLTPAGQTGLNNQFAVTGVLSYELDLWERLAQEQDAAQALLAQSEYAHHALQLNIVADLVATYFDFRNAERQQGITEATIASREETLRLEQLRYQMGQSDELSLRQAESELQSALAQLPVQRERVRVLEGALAVLTGMSPAALMDALNYGDTRLDQIRLPEVIPALMPAELLQRRPDIRAAEAGLMAAHARIGVAEASRFPSFSLSALLGTRGLEVDDLFTGGAAAWGLTAGLIGPLIDFGRTQARIESAEAQAEQAEIQYQSSVQLAFNEVRDALVIYQTRAERTEAVRRQEAAYQRTLELAEIRYREGLIGFIEVLDAQRALMSAQLALSEAMRDQLIASATLFKALGGGWQAES
ncbi:MAG: efflux transporter outer membrane subunit [Nitrincola lacisaponensis]|uniref:efflux transporter outer membrane subunit n=1 Tax=Nitrincola lacisaponensis TaxID=267850 RepID=UPI00391888DC